MEDHAVTIEAHVWHLAVPTALLRTAHGLIDIFEWFDQTKVLYVIIGEQPDQKESQRWEFEDAEQGRFITNDEHDNYVRDDGEYNSEGTLHALVEEFLKVLREEVGNYKGFELEIRPVFAVRK